MKKEKQKSSISIKKISKSIAKKTDSLKDSKKFYTILKGNYHISIEGSPEIFVRNLPKNVEFIIDDFQDKSS
ncbi:MAG: hypothetical protein P4L35_13610, partial [Ignavibacteriaceae bacterium]|nr:hypothetical protein [Ignavibacteriaceae bacterium]